MERRGWRQRASLRGGGLRGTASPARVGAPWKWRRGLHSQEKSPRCSTARAANGAMEPGLQLGSPSVRNGSGESYPDPSETKKKRRATKSDKTSEFERNMQTKTRQSTSNGGGLWGGGDHKRIRSIKKDRKKTSERAVGRKEGGGDDDSN